MNALIESSSGRYRRRMEEWIDIALEEGVRFFVTSLGKPKWVADRVHSAGGLVYHDVTERKWAEKGLESGVDGLIAVNDRAGGHAGPKSVESLYAELHDLGAPVVCAGGIGSPQDFKKALELGYAGVQMGTAFIATDECNASARYKQALVNASSEDVVLTERLTGVPVSVLRTPYIDRLGLKAGPLAKRLLRGNRTKHWMRMLYSMRAGLELRRNTRAHDKESELWQAGKSVDGVNKIEPAGDIVRRFAEAVRAQTSKA